MRLDRAPRHAVAPLLILVACGPTVRPDGPGGEPGPPIEPPTLTKPGYRPGRQVLVGEMCPTGAAGRPGIAPLMVRGVQWSDAADAVADPIERGLASKFAVIGYDGERAGVFESLGAADAGLPQDVAAGTYLGSSPCTRETSKGVRSEDVQCNKSMRGCGLAIAEVGHGDDLPPTIKPGGACMAGDLLVADIDGDGRPEAFPIADFLDGVRAPAEEITAAPVATARCTARFSVYGLKLAPGVEPGAVVDPKYQVDLDVIGVADLDGDGRSELAIALRYPDSRSIVLYSGVTATRLERVGESVSWP
jgi:hypothetical protein